MSILAVLRPDLDGYPPILPGIALALVLAALLCTWVAQRLGTGRITAWLLLVSFGVILAVTLTPSREALSVGVTGPVTCDLSRIGPASVATYLRRGDPILNVMMLVPLGVMIGQLEHRQHRLALAAAAAVLPVAIEVTQAGVVALGRACQGGDVFDNLVGLAAGLAIGLAAGSIGRRAQARWRDSSSLS